MLKSVLGFGRKPTQEELNEVQSEIDGSPVFMATRTWCPLCKTAEATLKEYPVDMKVVEMNHRGKF